MIGIDPRSPEEAQGLMGTDYPRGIFMEELEQEEEWNMKALIDLIAVVFTVISSPLARWNRENPVQREE